VQQTVPALARCHTCAHSRVPPTPCEPTFATRCHAIPYPVHDPTTTTTTSLNDWNALRTVLALERTVLSWERTALSVLVFAWGVLKVDSFLNKTPAW
jgi:hypothetical protein